MIDLIDKYELIKSLNKVAMEHHENHIPMVEEDFRSIIHEQPTIDAASIQGKKTEMKIAIFLRALALIIAIITFALLAYYMNRWWMSLFSVLFTFSLRWDDERD